MGWYFFYIKVYLGLASTKSLLDVNCMLNIIFKLNAKRILAVKSLVCVHALLK